MELPKLQNAADILQSVEKVRDGVLKRIQGGVIVCGDIVVDTDADRENLQRLDEIILRLKRDYLPSENSCI